MPNTVQGMGLAFLKLRDKYAPNAVLAIHASSWGSGVDIATDHRTTVDPAAEADAVVAFINKAGIVGNPSGITPWDVIFNDVADHDAGWYGALTNDHWWDRNNAVFPNFTRWLAFMSRMHADTGLPLVEWQVPAGNQYFKTMNNTDGHYQDNRAEYFIAHPTQLTAAGIVAVLFGAGNAGQTSYMDAKGDGITNPAPVSSWQCSMCNTHTSTFADDDGGFLRQLPGFAYTLGSPPCTGVTASAAPTSPQASGTAITITGTASGCSSPLYQFWILIPGSSTWTIAQAYSSTTTFNWNTTGKAAGTYRFSVWARDSGSAGTSCNSLGCNDAFVPGFGYTLTSTPCTGLTASATPASPQTSGTTVTITGSASGCSNPQYQFWILAPGSSTWTIAQAYSTSTIFNWNTTGKPTGTYRYSLWVRDASSSGRSCNSLGCNDAFVPGTAYALT